MIMVESMTEELEQDEMIANGIDFFVEVTYSAALIGWLPG